MLNIKIKSNYKSITEKIIEKINKEFETYNIYNEYSRNKEINELNPDGSRFDNESVLDLISYKFMKERMPLILNDPTYEFEGNEEYYYALVPFQRNFINSLNRMNEIENLLIEKELEKEGLKITKLEKAMYLIIWFDKEVIE